MHCSFVEYGYRSALRLTAGFKSTKKGIQIHSPGIEGGEKEKGKEKEWEWEGVSGERKCREIKGRGE